MEVLVAAAIVVILMGVTSVAVFSYLEQAKEDAAEIGIRNLEMAVNAYKLSPDGGDYPADLNVLIQPIGGKPAPLTQHDLQDPWGRAYVYERENRDPAQFRPKIYSLGSNPGTSQRICNWGE
jgi:type II secretory pathway pseudopilin PulG